jgi:dTDP-D-glucose 4,6-dehydratase
LLPVKDRPGHDRRYATCADKLAHELDFRAVTPLADGLPSHHQVVFRQRTLVARYSTLFKQVHAVTERSSNTAPS